MEAFGSLLMKIRAHGDGPIASVSSVFALSNLHGVSCLHQLISSSNTCFVILIGTQHPKTINSSS